MKIMDGKNSCECAICKNFNEFNMPKEIIESAKKSELILFCGAGISTESKKVLPTSFYIDILEELNSNEYDLSLDSSISFPELMESFCKTVPNGRKALIRAIKSRFDRVNSFPELYNSATSFHKEVANIPQINTVVTTNWDDYFEKECGMFPIIDDKDVSMWDTFDKRVFKVHGSINSIGSIVATSKDYENCYDRLSKKPIGDRLKVLLGSQCVVFIGFSFGDEDLNKIIDILSDDMGDFANQFYLVTIDNSWKDQKNSKIIPIITDGQFFVHSLKNILQEQGSLINDDVYNFAEYAAQVSTEYHTDWINRSDNFSDKLKNYPEVILSVAYQDGLIHAYQRCYANRKRGDYLFPNYLKPLINSYSHLVDEHKKNKDHLRAYYDLGYLDGLINLQLFLETNQTQLPPLFVYQDLNFMTEKELLNFIEHNRDIRTYTVLKKVNFPEDTIPHFAPWYC